MAADDERCSIDIHAKLGGQLLLGTAELFLLAADPLITVLSGLKVHVQVRSFGIGGEECGVLLGGHIEVLIDLSTFSKFRSSTCCSCA